MKYLKTITLELNSQKCIGCRMCLEVCPHQVFGFENKKAFIKNKDQCMECGACDKNCPVHAISAGKGVGCAAAVINGMLRKTEPSCDCGNGNGGCCG